MQKRLEASQPDSCWNKADDDEIVFVLLARDVAAPDTILDWCERRLAAGKNRPTDPQIIEAHECAAAMIKQRAERAANSDQRMGKT